MRYFVVLIAGLVVLGARGSACLAEPWQAPVHKANGINVSEGASARYAETFALLRVAWTKDSDDGALLRLATYLDQLGRLRELRPIVMKQVKDVPKAQGRMRGLYGRTLVAEARAMGLGGFGGVIIVNGKRRAFPIPQRLIPPAAKKLFVEAAPHLRAGLRAVPNDDKLRTDLAQALEGIDPKENATEARELRLQAGAIVALRVGPAPAPLSNLLAKMALLDHEANALELLRPHPQHDKAELLHKRALVFAFCSHTIPFEYEPAVYGPVSLLAPRALLNQHLTRKYNQGTDTIGTVAPRIFPVSQAKREAIIETLGLDASDAAAAALLGALRHSNQRAADVDAIARTLKKSAYPVIKVHLAKLLSSALFHDASGYSPVAQRVLVGLAADLGVTEARPALRAALRFDTDLNCPRGIVAALGRLGEPTDAKLLLALAANPDRDVFFRRQAVAALARLAPDRLGELPDEPLLGLAVAAARYGKTPTEELKGRLLAAIGTEHETDDAATYCVEFGITDALPALEEFTSGRDKNHPSYNIVRKAITALKNKARANGGG